MARYGEAFRDRAVARLLLPESANVGEVSRETGVSVQTLERWREDGQTRPAQLEAVIATAALAESEEARASPQATRQNKKLIRERELLRKERALAETAALLVLSKKVAAIFNKGEGECAASNIARRWPETFTLHMPPPRIVPMLADEAFIWPENPLHINTCIPGGDLPAVLEVVVLAGRYLECIALARGGLVKRFDTVFQVFGHAGLV